MIDVFNISRELADRRGYDMHEGFTHIEAEEVVEDYVCAVCHNDLMVYQIEGDVECIVVCPEHGSIEAIGRVRNSTVGIDMERATRQYWQVIRNLSDLWGELIPPEPSNFKVSRSINELGY